MDKLRGVIPSGMALNHAGTRLYVAESGLNAVAIIDVKAALSEGQIAPKAALLGHIPTGWFPLAVTLSPDEKMLFIATQKGIGRGPRGVKQLRKPDDERYGFSDMPGMIAAVPTPIDSQLSQWTAEVKRNNGIADKTVAMKKLPASPLPRQHGIPSDKIKYVVFITKENHTFDGIFGGLKGSKSEADYAEWGVEGWARERGKAETNSHHAKPC